MLEKTLLLSVTCVLLVVCGSATSPHIILTSSECTVEKGCPRSAMVWASGSFTDAMLLTPAVFRHDSRLELKLSLCCGYKFNGLMLRDPNMWDGFVQELLSATPLRMLPLQAKNNLFPRESATLHDTNQFHRTMDSSYTPTQQDIAFGNDGDGDVLVLVTGGIGDDVTILKQQLSVIAPHLFSMDGNASPPKEGYEDDEKEAFVSSSLKISNTVLKCKCPHNLLVMPAVSIYPEHIPHVDIVSGPRCGTFKSLVNPSDAFSSEFVEVIRTIDDATGATRFGSTVSFRTSAEVPAFTTVEWAVKPISGEDTEDAQQFFSSVAPPVPTGSPPAAGRPGSIMFVHRVKVIANVRYRVELKLSRETQHFVANAEFVLRVPLQPFLVRENETALVKLIDTPHFGRDRLVVADQQTAQIAREAVKTTYFSVFWEHRFDILVFPHGGGDGAEDGDDGPTATSVARTNAFSSLIKDGEGNDGNISSTLKMRLGKNIVRLLVRDVDNVCPPTVIQEQVIDTLRAEILQPAQRVHVACNENVTLLGRNAHRVFSTLREKYPSYFVTSDEKKDKGLWSASWECHQEQPAVRGADAACTFAPSNALRHTSLVVRKKSVRRVQWKLFVLLSAGAMQAHPDHFDSTRVSFASPPSLVISSDVLMVYRRLSTIPPVVETIINTRQLSFELSAPAEAESGRWEVLPPLRQQGGASHESMRVTISCDGLSDFRPHVMKKGTVRFLAADRGEVMEREDGGPGVLVQCPDAPVEFTIIVQPVVPPPVVPQEEDVFTEQRCLTISAPRPAHRDEKISWQLPAESSQCNSLTRSSATASTLTLCGVQEGSSCPVVWQAANDAGATSKSYLVHRCFAAPNIILKSPVSKRVIEPIIVTRTAAPGGGSIESRSLVVPVAASDNVTVAYDMIDDSKVAKEKLFDASFDVSPRISGFALDLDASLEFLLPSPLSPRHSTVDGTEVQLQQDAKGRWVAFSSLAFPVAELGGANIGPSCTNVNFTVDSSVDVQRSESEKRLSNEFRQRFLCKPAVGGWRMLSIVPLATIQRHVRSPAAATGGAGLPHPTYALHVCNSTFHYYVHPALHRDFGFDFSWDCGSDSPVTVEKRSPTQSLLKLLKPGARGECTLTASNSFTDTSLSTAVLVKRVAPAVVDVTFEILSPNQLKHYEIKRGSPASANNGRGSSSSSRSRQQRVVAAPPPQDLKFVRIVGKSATIRARNVNPAAATWSVDSWVFHEQPRQLQSLDLPVIEPLALEAAPSTSGQRQLSPSSSEEDRLTSVVSLSSISISGIYTIRVDQSDPEHPRECPRLSDSFKIFTYFAQVLVKAFDVCGSSVMLQAVALPPELVHEFVAQWEVVSHQVSPTEILNSGKDFQRIRFEHGSNRPRTQVHGLDFGIYIFRWAIYTNSAVNPSGRVLLDFATVTVRVLTENLRSERLVTLSSRADIPTTSSTVEFKVPEEYRQAEGYLTRSLQVSRHAVNDSTASFVRVENIPIGSAKLEYTLQTSEKVAQWGDMFANSTRCTPQRRLFDVTRVSAFLVANTSLQHECDAYRQRANITMCIHASSTLSSSPPKAEKRPLSSSSEDEEGGEDEAVRLVSADAIEAIVKSGAEHQLAQHCVEAPWWATSAANWTYTVNFEDNRCVYIEVVANRFLSFEEASQPLFMARRRAGGCTVEAKSAAATPNLEGSAFITSRVLQSVNIHQDEEKSKKKSEALTQHFIPFYESVRDMVPKAGGRLAALRGLDLLEGISETETNIATGQTKDIVLRLDVADRERALLPTEPSLGGFFSASTPSPLSEPTLLWKCINNTLTGADIISYFSEIEPQDAGNRRAMSAGVDAPMNFWEEYVHAVEGERVRCEVVFQDLQHLIPTKNSAMDEQLPPSLKASTLEAKQVQLLKERRRRLRVPPQFQRMVPLAVLEEQLASIAVHHTWTRDGIDVTGLSQEIREALEQRKIKRWMIPEIEKARRHLGPLDASFSTVDRQVVTASASSTSSPSSSSSWIDSDDERVARYTRAIKAYETTTGEPVSAIMIRLPAYPKFTAPRVATVQARLSKAVMCGLDKSKINAVDVDAATVASRRIYIFDDPPAAVLAEPPFVKQCEVEAEMPLLRFAVSGTRFDPSFLASGGAAPSGVTFSEVFPSPTRRREDELDGVGLSACIAHYSKGAILRLNGTTLKEVELRLPPCPLFKMVSQKEYNDEDETAAVLQKMRVPRILRVRFHDAIAADTFTNELLLQPERVLAYDTADESLPSTLSSKWANASWRALVVGRDLVIDVLIRPTLARVYLRTLRQSLTVAPLTTPEDDLQGSSNGAGPLLLCEGELKQRGMELLVALLGDTWTPQIGILQKGTAGQSREKKSSSTVVVEWGSHNTAMKNGFSIVEHHGLDSTSHVLLTGRGMYRSHFLQYLHDEIYADEHLSQTMQFVRRYNDTLVGIAIPPRPAATSRRTLHDEDDIVPRISSFSAVEEIMFAVPGIATRCPGCLLADASFFIAGDFSGVWQLSRQDQAQLPKPFAKAPSAGDLTTPLIINFASSKVLPRHWSLNFLCPTTALQNMLRVQERLRGREPFLKFDVMTELHKDLLGEDTPLAQRHTSLFHSAPVPIEHVVRAAQASAGSGKATSAAPTVITFQPNESTLMQGYNLLATDFSTRFDKKHLVPQFEYYQDTSYSDGLWAVNATCVVRLCHYATPTSPTLRCTAVFLKPALIFVEDVDAPSSPVSFTHSVVNALFPAPQQPTSGGARGRNQRRQAVPATRWILLGLHHLGTAFLAVVVYFLCSADGKRGRRNRRLDELGRTTAIAVGIGALMLIAGLYLMAPTLWLTLWLGLWLTTVAKSPSTTVSLMFVAHFVWLLSAAPEVREVLRL